MEQNAITLHDAQTPAPAAVFASLADMARDPNIDAAKITALVDLQMRMMDRDKEEQFNRAKIAAIMEMPSITKTGAIKNKNGDVQSRYARFEDMHRVIMPILRKHGLVITFEVGHAGQSVTVRPILQHVSGHVERGEQMLLPLDTTGSKNGTQGAGSSASYGKRHAMKAMLNIIEDGEDDGGAGAGRPRGSGDPEWAEGVLSDAQRAAAGGSAAYAEFFTGLSPMRKGWLAEAGHHADLKIAAAAHDR